MYTRLFPANLRSNIIRTEPVPSLLIWSRLWLQYMPKLRPTLSLYNYNTVMGETIGSYTRLQRWKQNPKGIYYGNICAFNIWFLCPASAPNSNQYCKIKRATMLITTADSAFVFLPTHVLLPFRERSFLLPTAYYSYFHKTWLPAFHIIWKKTFGDEEKRIYQNFVFTL